MNNFTNTYAEALVDNPGVTPAMMAETLAIEIDNAARHCSGLGKEFEGFDDDELALLTKSLVSFCEAIEPDATSQAEAMDAEARDWEEARQEAIHGL